MEGPTEDIDSALESFREQWRAEVRAKLPKSTQSKASAHAGGVAAAAASGSAQPPAPSALGLYEEAVEMEARGNLGDSLRLYRSAFRMDDNVDQLYRAKHFPQVPGGPRPPPSGSDSSAPHPRAPPGSATSLGQAPHREQPGPKPHVSLEDLIGRFAGLFIEPAPPDVEGMPPPPCPIASLPEEVLLHILMDVAIEDVGDFVRLAQVCRRLAYLVATEERIWRRVCLGSEFGFGGMHRHWNSDLTWETGPGFDDGSPEGGVVAALTDEDGTRDDEPDRQLELLVTSQSLLTSTYHSWQAMFRARPRIRFNGCYISTVNYIRAGQASPDMVTWNSPVHVCTYYRYLRFFRDGTCISLLTTTEPAEVVQHLTKEMLQIHRGVSMPNLPSSVMQYGLKGRWRLGSAGVGAQASPSQAAPGQEQPAPSEGDLFVETEGVGKYMYRLDLAIKTAGKAARNNKLVWKGFYSYNRLTDDWGEFGLKNDKPFFFSRVKRFT